MNFTSWNISFCTQSFNSHLFVFVRLFSITRVHDVVSVSIMVWSWLLRIQLYCRMAFSTQSATVLDLVSWRSALLKQLLRFSQIIFSTFRELFDALINALTCFGWFAEVQASESRRSRLRLPMVQVSQHCRCKSILEAHIHTNMFQLLIIPTSSVVRKPHLSSVLLRKHCRRESFLLEIDCVP